MPDSPVTTTEWGVRWPHGEIVRTPGGESKAREMAAMKGGRPFTRERVKYPDHVTEWVEVDDDA